MSFYPANMAEGTFKFYDTSGLLVVSCGFSLLLFICFFVQIFMLIFLYCASRG